MRLTVHMVVKNEENWIWFALKAIEPFVDQILIYDTGSSDATLDIIKTISSAKIKLFQKSISSRRELAGIRQEMIAKTKTDWFLLVDGDEVWSKESLRKLMSQIDKAGPEILGAVVRTRNCVGDIYHYQSESAGQYILKGRKGHLTIRAFRKNPEFAWRGEYPLEAYQDSAGNKLNDLDEKLLFVDTYYYHLTHLKRSNQADSAKVIDRLQKYKLEIGVRARKQDVPEVFFLDTPAIVPDPFTSYTWSEKLIAYGLTPIRQLKRMLQT